MSEPILSLNDVSVWYSGIAGQPVGPPVLEGLDLVVRPGEFVTIVGPSGSGKSTLLQTVCGLIDTFAGEVTLCSTAVSGPQQNASLVFQAPSLLPWRTVLDNAAYGLIARGTKRTTARERAKDALDRVGLAQHADKYPGELSGGMQQRVNLARAMITDPALMVLDEPFAALDAQTREEMQGELLRIWSQTESAAIFVTHQIEEAVLLGDRVAVLSHGPRAKIIEIIDVPFPRPRSGNDLREDPLFVKLTGQIRSQITLEAHS